NQQVNPHMSRLRASGAASTHVHSHALLAASVRQRLALGTGGLRLGRGCVGCARMEMLLEPAMDPFETVDDLAKLGLIASDDRADALLVGHEDLVMQLATLGCQSQHGHAPVVRTGAALDEFCPLKSVCDCRDVALICEQQAT